MTARGPGGRIPPQGRPPQAPGVGKTAKRHDLERPATPGLQNSDLQQGDVSRLEAAQRSNPISKRTQPAARPQGRSQRQQQRQQPGLDIPDPLDFITGRAQGTLDPTTVGQVQEPLDVEKWRPMLQEIARNPTVSGPLTTTLMSQLTNISGIPNSSNVRVIDQNAADVALEQGLR